MRWKTSENTPLAAANPLDRAERRCVRVRDVTVSVLSARWGYNFCTGARVVEDWEVMTTSDRNVRNFGIWTLFFMENVPKVFCQV